MPMGQNGRKKRMHCWIGHKGWIMKVCRGVLCRVMPCRVVAWRDVSWDVSWS